MDQHLRVVVSALDRLTPTLRLIQTSLKQTGSVGQAAGAAVDKAMTAVQRVTQGAQSAVARMGAGVRSALAVAGNAARTFGAVTERAFNGVKAAAQVVRVAVSGMLGPLGAVARVVGTVGSLVGGLGLGGAFASIAKTGVDMNQALAGATKTLESLLGSSKAAAHFVGELEKEAAASAPTFKELLPIALQLVQAYGPSGLGKVIPTIRAFGDAAVVAAGGDVNRMQMALLQFRQMINNSDRGPSQEEVGGIAENLGVNIAGILKRAFGSADTEVLQKAGVTGMQVADAIVAGLNAQFGGAQARGATGSIGGLLSGISDAFNSLSATVTKGLNSSVMQSLSTFLKFLQGLGESQAGQVLMQSLTAIMTALGRALEMVVKQAEPFTQWLSKLATTENIVLLLSNIAALIQTIGAKVAQVFGIDLQRAFDPRHVAGWFDVLGLAVAKGIDTLFGLVRAFKEVGQIAKSAFQDASDFIGDFLQDLRSGFKIAFLDIQTTFLNFSYSLLSAIGNVMDGLKEFKATVNIGGREFGFQPFKGLDTSGIRDEAWQFGRDAELTDEKRGKLEDSATAAQNARRDRRAKRLTEDPLRYTNPGQRIGDAFTGRGRDTSAQDVFWAQFEANRLRFQQMFFGGVRPEGPNPVQRGLQLFGTGQRAAATVRSYSTGASSPSPSIPALPAGDPYAPVMLPNGQVVSAFHAQMQGLTGMPAGTGAAGVGGGDTVINVPISIAAGLNLQDPALRQQLHAEIDRRLNELAYRRHPGIATR